MNDQKPLISIITATYNCVDTLQDCLDSIESQRYQSVEHVVIDGASVDGTRDLLYSMSERFAHLVSEPDAGIYDALNKGIAIAGGDIVGFLHSDDLFAHDCVLQRIADAFSDPSVQGVYGDLCYVKKQDVSRVVRYWQAGGGGRSLSKGWMPPHPTLYVRRKWYEELHGFDQQYCISADYDLILRLFGQREFKSLYINEVLVKMRTGGVSNRSIRNILEKTREDYRAIVKNNAGGIGTLLSKNLRKFPQFILLQGR